MFVNRLRRSDAGVTLVEVLIAIVILGIIMVPLANALIMFLRNTDNINRRLNESHDIQISAAYLTQDVQSIGVRDWAGGYPFMLKQSVEVAAPHDGGLYPCGPAGTPAAVVRFAWDNPTAAAGQPPVAVASYVDQVVGGERQLRRITCDGTTVTSNVVLVHNLAGVDPPVCSTDPCTVPAWVRLTVRVQDPTRTGLPVTITLSGQRRQT